MGSRLRAGRRSQALCHAKQHEAAPLSEERPSQSTDSWSRLSSSSRSVRLALLQDESGSYLADTGSDIGQPRELAADIDPDLPTPPPWLTQPPPPTTTTTTTTTTTSSSTSSSSSLVVEYVVIEYAVILELNLVVDYHSAFAAHRECRTGRRDL